MIEIPRDLLERIRAHGAEAYPEECCGALLGDGVGARKIVRLARRLANSREGAREHRYLIGPEAYSEAEAAARAEGLEVVGIYHSHPDHPARPSEYDREHAWPWFSYVIVSVERGRPLELTSWVLAEDRARFDEEEVECL